MLANNRATDAELGTAKEKWLDELRSKKIRLKKLSTKGKEYVIMRCLGRMKEVSTVN